MTDEKTAKVPTEKIFVGIDPSISCTGIVAIAADGQILIKKQIRVLLKSKRKRRAEYIFTHVLGILGELEGLGVHQVVVAREAPLYSGRKSAQTAAGFVQGIVDAATGWAFPDTLHDEDWYEISVKSWRSIVLGTQSLSYTGAQKIKHPMDYIHEVACYLRKHSGVSAKGITSTDIMDAYCVALAARQIHSVQNDVGLLLGLPSVTRTALIDPKKRISKGIAPSRLDEATNSDLQRILRKF